MLLAATLSACAGEPTQLRIAAVTTNTLGQLLTLVDTQTALQQTTDRAAAQIKFPTDDAAYNAALAADNARADALSEAVRAQGLIRLGVSMWQDANDSKLWDQTVSCAAVSIGHLADQLEPRWHDAIAAVLATLATLTTSATPCTGTVTP
jgi:hypothetical protein